MRASLRLAGIISALAFAAWLASSITPVNPALAAAPAPASKTIASSRGWIGIHMQTLTAKIARAQGL